MSDLSDPPLRELNRAAKVWDQWFVQIKNCCDAIIQINIQPPLSPVSESHYPLESWGDVEWVLDLMGMKVNAIIHSLERAGVLEEYIDGE